LLKLGTARHEDELGEGVLPSGFLLTPAITIEGDPTPGASITIHYLFSHGDGVLAIDGLGPPVSLTVPPYDRTLAILPFYFLFYLPPGRSPDSTSTRRSRTIHRSSASTSCCRDSSDRS
jgi:hypothetical protein